jgi:hypothetical protein
VGALDEAAGTATWAVQMFRSHKPHGRRDVGSLGFAHYVLGSCLRRWMEVSARKTARIHARAARTHMRKAMRIFAGLHRQCQDAATGGIANTCRGALAQMSAVLGDRSPRETLRELHAGVSVVENAQTWERNDWLESWGQWCVFGAYTAIQHLPRAARRPWVDRFVEQGLSIADRLGNWWLRERLFSAVHAHVLTGRSAQAKLELSRERLAQVAATMGRLPAFWPIGDALIREASSS